MVPTKEQFLATIRQTRADLDAAISGLTNDELVQPGVIGSWSVKDIMAHIMAWEQEMLGWYRAGLRGEIPQRPDPDNIDPYNHMLYERHRDRSLAEIGDMYAASYGEVVAMVEAASEAELFTVGRYAWTGEYPLYEYIHANTDDHYTEHAAEIRAWRAG